MVTKNRWFAETFANDGRLSYQIRTISCVEKHITESHVKLIEIFMSIDRDSSALIEH